MCKLHIIIHSAALKQHDNIFIKMFVISAFSNPTTLCVIQTHLFLLIVFLMAWQSQIIDEIVYSESSITTSEFSLSLLINDKFISIALNVHNY